MDQDNTPQVEALLRILGWKKCYVTAYKLDDCYYIEPLSDKYRLYYSAGGQDRGIEEEIACSTKLEELLWQGYTLAEEDRMSRKKLKLYRDWRTVKNEAETILSFDPEVLSGDPSAQKYLVDLAVQQLKKLLNELSQLKTDDPAEKKLFINQCKKYRDELKQWLKESRSYPIHIST